MKTIPSIRTVPEIVGSHIVISVQYIHWEQKVLDFREQAIFLPHFLKK